MAADRHVSERAFVEIKMGRSKFPGKPSKIGNRKRVNLSSCALPEDNDSSKAAKNIYLGLSVFNETFGDNELVAPEPFCGFSLPELEEAMCKARLQQKEAEIEHKKQGIVINFWEDFQQELYSISCLEKTFNKAKLSFDGGGDEKSKTSQVSCLNSHKQKNVPEKKVKLHSSWIQSSPTKSLQSQAAKKLLDKAKTLENNKNNIQEKKFVLPKHSIRSLRVIKPNMKFSEDLNKRKGRKDLSACKPNTDEVKNSQSSGKIILREPRLQLDKTNNSLLEGPFSSPSVSSLNQNSQLKIGPMQSKTAPGSIVCGVCGIVRFYKVVELAKKFGIYCCEYCRKFMSKIIKSNNKKSNTLQCLTGKGLCGLMPNSKSIQFSLGKNNSSRCPACWLKLCLKNFIIPIKLKTKLLKLLPLNMQMGVGLELRPILTKDISNKFLMGSNIKDFKWLNENGNSETKDGFNKIWPNTKPRSSEPEKRPNNRKKSDGNKEKSGKAKPKAEAGEKARQAIPLKGPRVKHVCRSASLVLGQPLATFPTDSPSKKGNEDCKNCDTETTTAELTKESPEGEKTKPVEVKPKEKPKPVVPPKTCSVQPIVTKPRKKPVKGDNPISLDFWESYDPDEVCETGFGLIGSEQFSVRALCYLCGSSGQEKLIHCASCCEPYHKFCVDENQLNLGGDSWKYDWVCPRCTVCFTCGRTSGQQLKCVKCDNSYHIECVDRVGGRLLHSPDRPWVCSVCLRCKSCNGLDVSVFVGNLPLCKACFMLRQKGNYCPLCQKCYEDDDYDSKMMECGRCKCWVHAKCEGLSDEKYQVLSFLPESVEYVCRMCCVIPPAPWWIAVEAELKSGYLGVLKTLSKNRKACTMLKWSPRKQCTCRQLNSVSRALQFDEIKPSKIISSGKEEKSNDKKYKPAGLGERKPSIEVISHPTESLKLTLKIMKGGESEEAMDDGQGKTIVRVKKCPSNEESEDSLSNTFYYQEDSQASFQSLLKGGSAASSDTPEKRTSASPLNPLSDSGISSTTDDEAKANCLTDEENCRNDDGQIVDPKPNCDTIVSLLEEKRECFCFLDVDSYSSRSKPIHSNLMSIKKKVTTSEYSSLHQFHQDMQEMIASTNSIELMELYHQTMKEIFPWFDPKFSRVQSSSQKVSGTISVETTPLKSSPTKTSCKEECKIPKEKLEEQRLDYFYNDYVVEDNRICLMCKTLGDGPPGETGRLLYCGQNEWVHCNCALWSGEVFEEIDGSLQNVHSAISRGRSIRCPKCNLKGASIGCCARNCQETYHFKCAREVGCIFMDDKTIYCPNHVKESLGKLVQKEKDFEIRRPVYVELDKRRMKNADSTQIRFAVGALQVNSLGRFVMNLSDQPEAIIPEQFECTRLFWSCYEPWRIVRYHFSVRLVEVEEDAGVDCGINLTIDHSNDPEIVEWKLKQLEHFQEHSTLLDITDKLNSIEEKLKAKANLENTSKSKKTKPPVKRVKKEPKIKKIFDQFDSKEDENCLSDNQNTADLLPPDLEEAIFKDLPHDILDGISMQDIFMDIKNDAYEPKEISGDDLEDDVPDNKFKRTDFSELPNQIDFWDVTEDAYSKPSSLKRGKSEVLSKQQIKKTIKTYTAKSCALNCNANMDTKWKKNPKCHVTVNLLEPQERGNMLQELKFTDGLVSITTGEIDSKELKARLEDEKLIQEEGKENKCLPWHTRLQPRLLQVDGGVDSSSSGSEAGESPQRLIDENINSKIVALPQSSPYLDSPLYSMDSPMYSGSSSSSSSSFSPNFQRSYKHFDTVPQLDGINDLHSDSEDEFFTQSCKRPRIDHSLSFSINYKINQCDGTMDSESEDDSKSVPGLVKMKETKEEPVTCNQCHCTYRTKISYQRHLEACRSDFILSSSEGEMSDEESLKIISPVETELSPIKKAPSPKPPPKSPEKPESKKEIERVKRTYVRRKPYVGRKTVTSSAHPTHPILIQPNTTPTLIVQDIQTPNILPTTTFIEPGPAIGYVATMDSLGKPQLIATPNGLVSGNFQFPTAPEPQILEGLCLNSQTNVPGFIIQQPQPQLIQPQTQLVQSQPTPVMVSGDQFMLGPNGLFNMIPNPSTGGMILASHNQPVFYNMETIVSNTVMQTNHQFVSNVLATSYSQTSTQIIQAREMDQMVNIPSNYIVVGSNPQPNKIIAPESLICVQAPQTIIPNQASIQLPNQTIFNPTFQSTPSDPKLISTGINPLRNIQPLQVKQVCQPVVISQPVNQVFRPQTNLTFQSIPVKPKTKAAEPNKYRTVTMMRPSVNSSSIMFEKAVSMPKTVKTEPRSGSLVDYINNFKSEETILVNENVPENKIQSNQNHHVAVIQAISSPPVEPKPNTILPVTLLPKPSPSIELVEETPEVQPPPAITDKNISKEEKEVEPISVAELPKPAFNMPELSDLPSEESSNQSSPKNEHLPLQENPQSINTMPKIIKSPKVSPVKTPPEEKKNKKKMSDQNSMEPKTPEELFPKKVNIANKCEEKGPKLIFDVTSDDGFKSSSASMAELWANICDSVQEMRGVFKIPFLPLSRKGCEILGMKNHGLQFCLEQLKGVEHCLKYKFQYFAKEEPQKDEDDEVLLPKQNPSGCARTEMFTTRKDYDMFAWLESKHRRFAKLSESAEEALSSIRRANNLPMAMRYRNLKDTSKLYVRVHRSKIHGKGLFCLREIESGEMVIEYAGEVIRSTLTDKREKYYTDKGIGCYMFRIDDHFVVDATMKGNAARFINHSCEPNCYSRVIDILGKKHIVIFALRKIAVMEELTYDYKFPFEDEKISCHCQSKKCRKYLN